MKVVLNYQERLKLARQPDYAIIGGFQALNIRLQRRVNPETGELDLTHEDIERIGRYAGSGHGGWQRRLKAIFGRTLGDDLGAELVRDDSAVLFP